MKQLFTMIAVAATLIACQENEASKNDFTGNESSYPLFAGSDYPISGTVTFKEKKDGNTLIQIKLTGTEGDTRLPVHLHSGDVSKPDADILAVLFPVVGKTGVSETVLTAFSDETPVSYQKLVQYDACIKIHLSDTGPDKNIILAAGNIGVAITRDLAGGRNGIRPCKTE